MWTDQWPTENGWYWFHGVRSQWGREPLLLPVKVRHDATGRAVYIADGVLLDASEGAQGHWYKMTPPDPREIPLDMGVHAAAEILSMSAQDVQKILDSDG